LNNSARHRGYLFAWVMIAWFAGATFSFAASHAPLEVSIAIPEQTGDTTHKTREMVGYLRWGYYYYMEDKEPPHFHVVIRNVSGKPQRLWPELWGKGYQSLTFEVSSVSGQKWVASMQDAPVKQDSAPDSMLAPGECMVVDIYYTDRKTWGDGFWLSPGNPTGMVTLRAIFTQAKGDVGMWTGRAESQPVACVIK
jgi:hypothetical protein